MQIERATYQLETWLASEGVHSAKGSWAQREGLLLRVEDGEGRSGRGEVSPLPGYSSDTLEGCRVALTRVLEGSLGLPEEPAEGLEVLGALAELQGVPAALFGLEMAYLDLLRQRFNPSEPWLGSARWASFLSDTAEKPRRVAALLENASVASCIASAASAHAAGIRTFKLKISDERFALGLEQLTALRQEFSRDVQLRVDANQSLLPASLGEKLEALSQFELDFLEEPCVSLPQLWSTLRTRKFTLPVPIALDESLRTLAPHALSAVAKEGLIHALVLKPMALGGIGRCLEWANWAEELGLKRVVSHLFSGPTATLWERRLATSIGTHEYAQGLHYEPK